MYIVIYCTLNDLQHFFYEILENTIFEIPMSQQPTHSIKMYCGIIYYQW